MRSDACTPEQFWNRVDKSAGPDGCWPWTTARDPNGYGRVGYRGDVLLAHRVAFLLATSELPEGKIIMHACDNPPCCNPAHLSAGTHAENQRDKWAKGRSRGHYEKGRIGLRGELCPTAKLTLEQVREIRKRSTGAKGEGAQMAREYGLSRTHVNQILRGERWAEVA